MQARTSWFFIQIGSFCSHLEILSLPRFFFLPVCTLKSLILLKTKQNNTTNKQEHGRACWPVSGSSPLVFSPNLMWGSCRGRDERDMAPVLSGFEQMDFGEKETDQEKAHPNLGFTVLSGFFKWRIFLFSFFSLNEYTDLYFRGRETEKHRGSPLERLALCCLLP